MLKNKCQEEMPINVSFLPRHQIDLILLHHYCFCKSRAITISWVSRDDLADVAVAVLTSVGHDGASYDITRGQALTLAEAAKEFSRVTGLPAAYRPETIEEARASRAKFHPSEWELEAWVST